MDDITKAINDSINNENCSEVKRSLQLNVKLNRETMIANNPPSSKGKGKSARSKRYKRCGDRTPTSYITDYCAVNQWLYEYLKGLVKDFNSATQHFFFHVFCSCMLPENLKDGTWIPIPRKTLDKKFGKEFIDIPGLIEAGLLERSDSYSIEYGECYCYRIPLNILIETEKYYSKSVEETQSLAYLNLIDGKKVKASKSKLTYGNNNDSLPEIVYKGIKGITITAYHNKQLNEYLNNAIEGITTERHHRKLLNDMRCAELIIINSEYYARDLLYYLPVYEPQGTGRITEARGGFQSCSRAMKKAAFTFSNCYNYDLKSSQIFTLLDISEKNNISTENLRIFLDIDKKIKADEVGITKAAYKNCMYAFVMGARSKNFKGSPRYWDKKAGKYKPEFFNLSVVKYLLKEAQRLNKEKGIIDNDSANKALTLELLERFNKSVEMLSKHLESFNKWLVDDYCKAAKKGIVRNLCDMPFDLKPFRNSEGEYVGSKRKELCRKLTAFLLQGTEAAFVHYLSQEEIQLKYNYEVISNQHDGLITMNLIPDAAVEEAKTALDLPYAYLEIKEICIPEEETWWLVY